MNDSGDELFTIAVFNDWQDASRIKANIFTFGFYLRCYLLALGNFLTF